MMSTSISERTTVAYPTVVTEATGNGAGRPQKVVDANYLQEAFAPHRRITMNALAKALAIHRNTLRKKLGYLRICRKFDAISDEHLDMIVQAYKVHKPKSGLRYITGFLRSAGLRIQRERICLSLQRVDGLGQTLRRQKTIQRRKYCVPRSNALWHCDGHHKLIWWGIVIHGFVDGRDRLVCHLLLI